MDPKLRSRTASTWGPKRDPNLKPSKNTQRSEVTRDLILRAAKDVFAQQGYEKADLDSISRKACRSKGALYGHFKSKADLFLALIEQRISNHTLRCAELSAKIDKSQDKLIALREFFME